MRNLLTTTLALAVLATATWAAHPAERVDKRPTPAVTPAVKPAAKTPRDIGSPLPLPINQDFARQNSDQDKLHVQITYSKTENGTNVAYLRVVWGDLDNLIKGCGRQYYSNWDGSVALTNATGEIVHKIQFDDGGNTKLIKHLAPSTLPAHPKAHHTTPAGPGPGSGRDEVITASGPKVEWKAGVVGALDGLTLKLSSPNATFSGTVTAGKFSIPFTVIPEPTPAPAVTGAHLAK